MDIIELFRDYNIPYANEGERHHREGWINTPCPFCTGNPGNHLGYPINGGPFVCHRCGIHPIKLTLSKLLSIPESEVNNILRNYGGSPTIPKEIKRKIRKKSHKLPPSTNIMQRQHRKYLEKRNFDPEKLEKEWMLLGTGPIAKLDKTDYKHRIIAPIYWNGEQVSFQGRDITNKSQLKYLTCSEERELIHHKHILYGRQDQWSDIGIIVEGITDVWRLGVHAVATFGIKYTPKQMRLIAKSFKKTFILFDDDPQAIEQAKQLVSDLRFRGQDSIRIPLSGDPGGMKQDDANYLVNSILKNKL